MIKVLHLFNEYLSYSESWAYNILNSLEGVDVAIGAVYFTSYKQYENGNFTLIKHPDSKLLYDYYQSSQLSFAKRLMVRLLRIFRKSEIKHLKIWIKEQNPHLIHIHFGPVAIHFKRLIKRNNIPFIVSFYGFDYTQAPNNNRKIKKGYQWIFNHAQKIFVEGSNGKRLLKELGCQESKLKVIKLGVSTANISFSKKSKSNPTQFIQIANFTQKKGQLQICKAVNNVKKLKERQFRVTFIGNSNTSYGRQVKDFVKEKKIENYFNFKEAIPYSRIDNELEKYDVFIHPSHYSDDGDCEGGAPTILLDAQAKGLPVLSTNHCDIPEYVINKKTGILVEEQNIKALSKGILEYIEMENNEFLNMSENARKHIEENYDVLKNGKALKNAYSEIINRT